MKGWLQTGLLGLLCAAAVGCRHKQPVVYIPVAPATTVPLEKAPGPPLLAKVPVEPPPPLPPRQLPPKQVKRPRRKVVPVPAPAPVPASVEVASLGTPPVNVIGALTAGGEQSSAKLQEAAEIIGAIDKKIAALPADWKQKQKDGLARVKYFEQQAQAASRAGDGEGAVTLATKAKVLLEDLTK